MAAVDSCWRPTPNPRCVQWWYFLLRNDEDGEVWRVRIWVQGPPGPEQRCGAELCRYPLFEPPEERFQSWGPGAFHAERDRLHVMADACSVEERAGCFLLAVRLGDLALELEVRSSLEGSIPVLGYDVDGVHGWRWSVPVLRGRFHGRLWEGRRASPLEGMAFFDYVCSDIRPSPSWLLRYRGWCWGVLWMPGCSMLFLDVDFAGAPMRRSFLAEQGGPIRESSEQHVEWSGADRPYFRVHLGGGEWRTVMQLWSWPKRHRVLDGPWRERAINAWPWLRKRHGLGNVGYGLFYYEWMTAR